MRIAMNQTEVPKWHSELCPITDRRQSVKELKTMAMKNFKRAARECVRECGRQYIRSKFIAAQLFLIIFLLTLGDGIFRSTAYVGAYVVTPTRNINPISL